MQSNVVQTQGSPNNRANNEAVETSMFSPADAYIQGEFPRPSTQISCNNKMETVRHNAAAHAAVVHEPETDSDEDPANKLWDDLFRGYPDFAQFLIDGPSICEGAPQSIEEFIRRGLAPPWYSDPSPQELNPWAVRRSFGYSTSEEDDASPIQHERKESPSLPRNKDSYFRAKPKASFTTSAKENPSPRNQDAKASTAFMRRLISRMGKPRSQIQSRSPLTSITFSA